MYTNSYEPKQRDPSGKLISSTADKVSLLPVPFQCCPFRLPPAILMRYAFQKTEEQQKRKTSTIVHLQNDCRATVQSCTPNQRQDPTFWMAEMVAEAHSARTTLSVSLDPIKAITCIIHLD